MDVDVELCNWPTTTTNHMVEIMNPASDGIKQFIEKEICLSH